MHASPWRSASDTGCGAAPQSTSAARSDETGGHDLPELTTTDGTRIYYKDWDRAGPIAFGHGWPLPADEWDAQMMFFLLRGYRPPGCRPAAWRAKALVPRLGTFPWALNRRWMVCWDLCTQQLICGLLADVREGASGVLLLVGDAGIGKARLVDHTEQACADFRVLRIAGVESEAHLGFAALHRLLRPFLSDLDDLSAPQCDALRSAFGLASGPPAEAMTMAGLAETDAGVLLSALAAGHVDAGAADRIAAETGGNPLALAEVAGVLGPEQLTGREPLPSALPVGPHLERHFREQIQGLPPRTRELLLLLSAAPLAELTSRRKPADALPDRGRERGVS